MRTPFAGPVLLAHGQAYLTTGGDGYPELDRSFAGQTNGPCGAAVPGTCTSSPV